MNTNLPPNWSWVKLGDVSKIKGGKRLPKGTTYSAERTSYPYLRVVDFNNMSIDETDLRYLDRDTQETIKAYTIACNDLYISIAGSIGKVGKIPANLDGANLTENAAKITEIQNLDLDFLRLYLNSQPAQEQIKKNTIATTQPKLALFRIEKIIIPLPPLPEQKKIVEKMEELFSYLDSGVASLKKAKEQIRLYRQSVLASAFSGRLTQVARGEQNTYLNGVQEVAKAAEPKVEYSNQLPDGWKWVSVSDICNVVRGGSPRPAGDPKYYDGKIPFLKVRDLTKDHNTYLTTFEFTIKEAGLHKTRLVKPNTLLLSNSGATLGIPKICMIEATMNDGIAAFLDLDERSNLYLYYFWLSKTEELRNINMGAAQPNLNTNILKNYLVPYCSFGEQQFVVEEIEKRFSEADNLEKAIDDSLAKSETLRQSILKQAFEGKLV